MVSSARHAPSHTLGRCVEKWLGPSWTKKRARVHFSSNISFVRDSPVSAGCFLLGAGLGGTDPRLAMNRISFTF